MKGSNSGNPTLAYLHRRFLANRLLAGVPAGKFLEIGVGSGRFYEDLIQRGFSGLCMDLNAELIREHQTSTILPTDKVEFRTGNFFTLSERFDLLVAFEVLEHYQDDLACLQRWNELLRPGGRALFSVPAHIRQWTENDQRAGHARRYEKAELSDKLKTAGFEVETLWCYGFPILNFTYPLSSKLAAAHAAPDKCDPLMADYGKTSVSGVRAFPWLARFMDQKWFWVPLLHLQLLTTEYDLGIGFLVKCRKSPE